MKPIVLGDVRFEPSLRHPGFLFIYSVESGDLLRAVQVYPQKYDSNKEKDVQEVYFKSMALDAGEKFVLIVNERNQSFQVPISTAGQPRQWPAWLSQVKSVKKDGSRSVVVRLEIPNPGNKELLLDGPSVVSDGKMKNDMFDVVVDGKKIPYYGMMKKRIPPTDFIAVKPGAYFMTDVELGGNYEFPSDGKKAVIRYGILNLGSPQEVMFVSNELIISP